MAIEEDLSQWDIAPTKKMISYAFGYIVINFLIGGGFSLVFYYYEVEIGLSVVLLGLAFLIFALWNMVNDPLLGFITDKPRKWTKRWGLRAPWVVITSIPILILYFFIWAPPVGASQLTLFIWFVVFTCLFDTFLSIYNGHVYGGFTNQFPSEYERRRAFSIASLLMGIIFLIMGVTAALIIEYGNPSSFILVALIMIIAMAFFNIILFFGIKESEEMKEMFIKSYEKAEKKSFYGTMKTALKQKNFRVSLAGYTSSITATTLSGASGIYMWKYVYDLPLSAGILPGIVGVVGFLIFIPFWSNYAKKHGFKKTYYTCFFFHGLSYIPFLFTGIYTSGAAIVLEVSVFAFIQGVFVSGEVIMLMPVAADTYDEVSMAMKKRVDATLVGVRTFFFRIAFVAVGVLIPLIHIMTGFDPTPGATQTDLALLGIRIHAALIPAIIFIVMSIVFKKFYTLEGAEKEAMVAKLKDLGIYR